QHIRFAEVDLGRAPPPLEPYDRLTSRFGLMFFDDPPEAFARLRRWLAPGGRFAFAVWGPVADNAWATSVRDAVGARVTLPVPIPGAPGPFRYGDVDALLALLGDAGFFELQATDWRGPLPMGSATTPRDAARFALRAFAAMAGALAEAGDTVRGEVERDLADGWTTHLRDGRVQLAARVHLVTGSG
ncbi:MAG: methyltransferase domain-containing protein, partial [Myxococcota bacterium]